MKRLALFENKEVKNLRLIFGGTSPDGDVDKDKVQRPTGQGGSGTNPTN